MIFDTFPMNDELDMLECRLTELQDIPNLVHVIVEASITHQGVPKPSHYLDNQDRFTQWKDRIRHVWAEGLPTVKEAPDPWAREHAQRDYTILGLQEASGDDVVLHGDLDEIPRALQVRNCHPQGAVVFGMRFHPFAVDWLHPEAWRGTVACKVKNLHRYGDRPFPKMRDSRNWAPCPPGFQDAGWHFSWVGGREYGLRKLASFCHPEIADRTLSGLREDIFNREGWHVDGQKLTPVTVDHTWPRWVVDGSCPKDWFR